MERSDAPRVNQRPWGNHHDRYYSGDERGGGAFHTASKVLHSSNMATGDCRHRSNRDHRLDVSTGLWICQTSLSADLVDPAPGQMVSLAKPAKRLQGSMAPKRIEFPVKNPALAILHATMGAVVQRRQIATPFCGGFVKSFTMSCGKRRRCWRVTSLLLHSE